jgi:PIN domain nuclease of toxin-antitoxin system
LLADGIISAPNWSEILQKTRQKGRDTVKVASLLKALGVSVAPFTEGDAAEAAALWFSAPNLSLADRACLVLARRLGLPAVTADRLWPHDTPGVFIRLIR